MELILIVIILVLLFRGGGGYWGRDGDSGRDIVRPLATLSQGPNARQRRALLK
jgi:hypothetical protein